MALLLKYRLFEVTTDTILEGRALLKLSVTEILIMSFQSEEQLLFKLEELFNREPGNAREIGVNERRSADEVLRRSTLIPT